MPEIIGLVIGATIAVWLLSILSELSLKKTPGEEKQRVLVSVAMGAGIAVMLSLAITGKPAFVLAYIIGAPIALGLRLLFLPKAKPKEKGEIGLDPATDTRGDEYKCSECGAALSADAEIWPSCGADVREIEEDEAPDEADIEVFEDIETKEDETRP
jgi:hypothetical protein